MLLVHQGSLKFKSYIVVLLFDDGYLKFVSASGKLEEYRLVRKKKEGLFTVDYLSVEIENNKIIDVKG